MFNILGDGNENDRIEQKYKDKALVNLWSSISEDTHDAFDELADEYGCSDIATYKQPDRPFKRNVFHAFSTGGVAKKNIREAIERELKGISEVFTVSSPDGSGMMALHGTAPFQRTPLDALTFLLVVSSGPRTHEMVCRAFNLATLEPDKYNYVFISKADHDVDQTYPRRIAQMIATMRWMDSTNIFHRAATYREIEPDTISTTREKIKDTLSSLRTELGSRPQERLGFDPQDWLADGDVSDIDLWGEEKFEAFVRIPEDYEGTNMADNLSTNIIDVDTDAVPVPKVQVLLTREVSAEFVERVKTTHLRWLLENPHEIDHWLKIVRSERGRDVDPRRAAEEFVTDTLRIRDPDVQAVLEEETGQDLEGRKEGSASG